MKKLILSTLVAAASVATMQTNAAAPEVSASVSAANFYLWRGLDLGDGSPQIAGDLSASYGGLYGGTWIASGDDASGTEVDLYAGYGGEVGAFNYDLSYWSYIYPESDISFGEAAEGIVSLGYGPLTYSYYHDLSKDSDDREWTYMTLGAGLDFIGKPFDKFSVLLGKHHYQSWTDTAGKGHTVKGMYHADLSYAYNDNLTFTVSQPFKDNDNVGAGNTKVHVNLSLPLKF